MATLSPRRLRARAARKKQIIDAAMEIVETQGFDSLTVHRIAEAIDVVPGTLYQYFKGKEAIVAELESIALQELTASLRQAREAAGDLQEPLAPVLIMARFLLDLGSSHPRQLSLIRQTLAEESMLLSDEDIGPVAPALMGLLQQGVLALDGAADAGALSKGRSDVRSLALFCSVIGVLQTDKLKRYAPVFAAEVIGEELVEALMTGWGADPSALQRARRIIG